MIRRTGKTFRALLKSLLLASEGKYVVYVTPTEHAVCNAFQRAVQICHCERLENMRTKRDTIYIGTGTVAFMSKDEYKYKMDNKRLAGLKTVEIFD